MDILEDDILDGSKDVFICEECKLVYAEDEFYKYNYKKTYPFIEKRSCKCKSCMTKNINVLIEDSFLPVLAELDIPYIPSEWFKLVNNHLQRIIDNPNIQGKIILGKYKALMNLYGFASFTFKDSVDIFKTKIDFF